MSSLIERYYQLMQANPAAPVVIEQGKVWSRAALWRRSEEIAALLLTRGVTTGQFVGLSLGHNCDHLAAMLAVSRVGGASVPMQAQGPRAKKFADRFSIKVVLTDSASQGKVADLPSLNLNSDVPPSPEAVSNIQALVWPPLDGPARIGLTSGTTGEPNAILYSHRYWLERIETTIEDCDANTRAIVPNLQLTMGNLAAFSAILAGGVAVFATLHNVKSFYQIVRQYAITHAITTPGSIEALAKLNPEGGFAFPSLKYLRVIGGAFEPHLVQIAAEKLTPCVFHPYGLSEVGAISMADLSMMSQDPEYAGVLKPGCEARTRNESGEILNAGEVGIIEVKVPGMPSEYFDNPDASKSKFKEGWFVTGDLGSVRKDGAVRIDGRSDHKINIAGRKIQPERVESALLRHPDVAEVAVFASDKAGDKMVFAAVVIKEGHKLTLPLRKFCSRIGLGNQAPDRFVLVGELPKNESGKLLRRELDSQLDVWLGNS